MNTVESAISAHVCALALLLSVSVAGAATFTVNTTSDDVDADLGDALCQTIAGGGDCSVRAAVQQANATAGTDEIVIPAGVYSLITPGADENASATGDLDITQSVSIRGAGADRTIINGGRLDRVFDIDPARAGGVTVEISGLTVQDGSSEQGGGIANLGTLTLTGVAISSNTATGDGGGIFSRGALTLVDSLVNDNDAASDGAGIYCEGALNLTNCTISGNTAGGSAAGIDNRGPLTMRFSTISGNSAASGAGGVVSRTSVANTSAGSTIIAGNTPKNCTVIKTAGNNIEATNTCGFTAPSDRHDTDPQLCPLGHYGGTTQTYALMIGSAARDAGATTGCPATDQRGLPRPQEGDGQGAAICDAGAVEAQGAAVGCEESTPTPTVPLGTPTPTMQGPTATPGLATPTPTGGVACAGDCNNSHNVSVDELVRGVNIALNRANLSTCPVLDRNASGSVAVDELVAAVNSALRGCPE